MTATSRGQTPANNDGGSIDALITPALLVHANVFEGNLALMASRTQGPVKLRPHFKTHKSVSVARRQMEAGAVGITCATVWEAKALTQAGIPSVLIANQVIGRGKAQLAAELARQTTLTVAVDSHQGVSELSSAARSAGATIQTVIEFDIGMDRGGVRRVDDALELATQISDLPSLRLVGVMGYEGHCVMEPDDMRRSAVAQLAIDKLAAGAQALRDAGHTVDVVTAGGTGTSDSTGLDPRVTDIQAGSYVFMDAAYSQIATDYAPSLVVLATVVARHGQTAVLDCGLKTLSRSQATPRVLGLLGSVRYLAEEHTVIDLQPDDSVEVGDRVEVVTGHCCETVNLHDRIYLVEDGRVLEVWPVMGRGAGG